MISEGQILEKLDWGKPAIKLLNQCKMLTENEPAALMIRHSERINIEKPSEIKLTGLTDVGREAAKNFGQLLPEKRTIQIFHSPVARCLETAECILDGAKRAGLNGIIVGELGILEGPKADWGKFSQDLIKDWPYSGNYWLSGRYTPSEVEPSLDYSKRVAREFDAKASETPSNPLILYVSHDLPILALLFHWFGVSPKLEYARFLNGFLFQRKGDRISLFLEDLHKECELPYWWGKFD